MSATVLRSLCVAETLQEPWASWSTDKQALHHYTGMSVAEVEMVYALCSEELLTLAAQMRQPNVDTPTLSSHNLLALTLYWLRPHPTKAAWKYEITCDFSHRIVSTSDGYHGGAHDMRIIRESGLLDQVSDDAQIMGDRGYKGKLGIVVTASRKAKVSKEVQQLEDERRRGHELQSERAAIENINKRVKEWAVVRGVWNGQRESAGFFDSVMRVVCVLTNLLLIAHPIRSAFLRSGSRTSVS